MTSQVFSGPDLSLIVALYYEEDCVAEFITQIRKHLDHEPITYEIVFIDDGSQDRTIEIVEEFAAKDARLKLLQLSRNHGKEAAVSAGIRYAAGRYMIMMDPDLQDPPDRIMDFYRKIEEGYDLVFGIRKERNDSWSTKIFSKIFWTFLNVMTGLKIPENVSVMRIFNRPFANEFNKYPERLRFIEGLFMIVKRHPNNALSAYYQAGNFARVMKAHAGFGCTPGECNTKSMRIS